MDADLAAMMRLVFKAKDSCRQAEERFGQEQVHIAVYAAMQAGLLPKFVATADPYASIMRWYNPPKSGRKSGRVVL